MIIVGTGISGSKRNEYLEKLAELITKAGKPTKVLHVGSMMFETAKRLGREIPEHKILDMSSSTLNYLRATVFEQIITEAKSQENLIISTHACFRWKKNLIPAFDFHYLNQLSPDVFLTIIDDIQTIKIRLERQHGWKGKFSLKELIVWRDEELFISNMIANYQGVKNYVITNKDPPEEIINLLFDLNIKKAYISYPMTYMKQDPSKMKAKNRFRDELRKRGLIIFDPEDIEEMDLIGFAEATRRKGKDKLKFKVDGKQGLINISEIEEAKEYIIDQTVDRDYKLISQSDMIIVYYPVPVLSPGVLSEMVYGFTNNKNVFAYFPKKLSPFFEYHATKIFKTEKEMIKYLKNKGIIK
ncbi:AAA family ATPase [Candidatus Bathyarchaeota archaeon]|nr:AAA family ATPase [Candidatus Bathyarchaeota archaeon]